MRLSAHAIGDSTLYLLLSAIIGLSVLKARLDDSFFFGDFRMLTEARVGFIT